jgi:hypothetical protein
MIDTAFDVLQKILKGDDVDQVRIKYEKNKMRI